MTTLSFAGTARISFAATAASLAYLDRLVALADLQKTVDDFSRGVDEFSALLAEHQDRCERWRRAIPPGPVAAPRRPAVVVPAEPPRGAGWVAALRAWSGR